MSPPTRVPRLRPGDLDAAQRDLYERLTQGPRANGPFRLTESDGSLTGPFGLMLIAPQIGTALSQLGETIRYESNLDPRLREIAILTVAGHHQCDYEWYAHERVARSIGMDEGELEALRRGAIDHWEVTRERIVHAATLQLARRRELDSATYSEAVTALGQDGLVELVTLVGYYDCLALLLSAFEVNVPEGEPAPFEADDLD